MSFSCPVKLTQAAIAHIKSMLQKEKNARGFRLSVRETGCSGYAYVPAIVSDVPEDDLYFEIPEGLDVYLDRESLPLLKNLEIDYVADSTGLRQKRLVFINPDEKGRCGCGESFHV
jgi:iron-sulfur cluster assembly protein